MTTSVRSLPNPSLFLASGRKPRLTPQPDMVLEDVTELYEMRVRLCLLLLNMLTSRFATPSDYSGNHTKLKKILLNGNNICMVSWLPPPHSFNLANAAGQLIPGGEGPIATVAS